MEEGEAAEDRARARPAWPAASAVTLAGLTVEYFVSAQAKPHCLPGAFWRSGSDSEKTPQLFAQIAPKVRIIIEIDRYLG